MAGSKRWFKYVTDEGSSYGLQLDESNTELVNISGDSQAVIAAGLKKLPQGIKPRFVDLVSDDNKTKRRCYVLTSARYADLQVGGAYTLTAANFSGVSADTPVLIRLKSPELMRRQPFQGDTALLDGDNP